METVKQFYFEVRVKSTPTSKGGWVKQAGLYNSYKEVTDAARTNGVYPFRVLTEQVYVAPNKDASV